MSTSPRRVKLRLVEHKINKINTRKVYLGVSMFSSLPVRVHAEMRFGCKKTASPERTFHDRESQCASKILRLVPAYCRGRFGEQQTHQKKLFAFRRLALLNLEGHKWESNENPHPIFHASPVFSNERMAKTATEANSMCEWNDTQDTETMLWKTGSWFIVKVVLSSL